MAELIITKKQVKNALAYCWGISKTNYENFPVASVILPKDIRDAIAVIYAFARTADNIADEGFMPNESRLMKMTNFESKLYDLQFGKPPIDPIFIALEHVIEQFKLPYKLFYDLLAAFRQDILKNEYFSFTQVNDYCQYSANPIGRLMLYLAGDASAVNVELSDNICTGLQLLNFVQDFYHDLHIRDRCYIPRNEMMAYGVSLSDIRSKDNNQCVKNLINHQLERASTIFMQGVPLAHNLTGKFGFEIKLIISSGLKLIQKLNNRDNIYIRPTINKIDYLSIFLKSFFIPSSTIQNNTKNPLWKT